MECSLCGLTMEVLAEDSDGSGRVFEAMHYCPCCDLAVPFDDQGEDDPAQLALAAIDTTRSLV